MKKYIWIFLGSVLILHLPVKAQQRGIPNAGELEIALQKLNVLGSVLYVGAHPDDENTSLLASLSKGRKYRAAYLSVTRGEGGQNLIGPEQGAEIGLIRTHELLAARRIDGAEQFFTRAVDFGYSKTAEESLEFWGKENVLGDIVGVIRRFRPDVIISRFSDAGSGGHGHHTATGMLIKEAFTAAADPNRFPEQLKVWPVWRAKRFLWNSGRPGQGQADTLLRIDTGEYNPLLGKSYTEMGGESRSQHKSQGFGSAGRRGTQWDYFAPGLGDPAAKDLFDGVDVSWNRIPGGQKTGLLLAECLGAFDPRQPVKSIPGLLAVHSELTRLEDSDWVRLKKEELARVIQACSGIWMEAIATDFAAAPGDEIQIKTTIINRSDFPVTLQRLGYPEFALDTPVDRLLKNNEVATTDKSILIPKGFPLSQPHWLEASPRGDVNPNLFGSAENPPSLSVKIGLSIEGRPLEYSIPVLFRWTDPVNGELYRPLEIRPRVTIRIEDQVKIFPDAGAKSVKIRLKSHSKNAAGTIRLKGPVAWRITPASLPFSLSGKYEEAEVVFEVVPPKAAQEAVLTAEVEIDGEKTSRDLVEISYPHIYRRAYFPDSRIKVVKFDIKTEGKKIGYIMGAGDDVAESLRQLGYDVTMLTDEMMETADLSSFDAVVAGVRAFNTRDRLNTAKGKLLQYVERGGTIVAQYNVAAGSLTGRIGPYPLAIGRDRVCVELAPITFPIPDHPLLNFPNKITAADFEGWIQERGLNFASEWDPKYEAVLSSHDPGEPDKKGGLLFTRYGKGVFIYMAYAGFRQLPAGVPGAFRLFANLLSAGRVHGR